MKRVLILLSLAVFLTVSCEKREIASQTPNVSFTPCRQSNLKSSELSGKADVEFTDKGVQITYYNFEVTCDFADISVTHTFTNGVLNITQKSFPNQANCVCHTDVSYTIDGILQNEVNVIFINEEQVYCHNDKGFTDGLWLEMGDKSIVPTSDIDYYKVSQHTIYLKKKVPYLKNVHGTVSVCVGNDVIYECSIHSGICSHIPMGQPYIFDMTFNEEKISILFNTYDEQQVADPRSDARIIAALKKYGQYRE